MKPKAASAKPHFSPMRKTIAVDIDDTIAESLEAFRKKANEHAGSSLGVEDYKIEADYWGYYEKVWEQHGIADLVNATKVYEDLHTDQSLVPLLPGAQFAVSELMKKYKIILITARDPKWEDATKSWLQDQFGDRAPELYFSQAHRDTASKTKGQICKDVGAEWLIDDNVEHCLGAVQEGVTPLLFGSYGWQYKAPNHLTRCHDWQAVLEYFDGQA